MKKRFPIILILLVFLVGQNIWPSFVLSQTKTPSKFHGFLGSYHPFNGTAYGGEGWSDGELMQKAFDFGENAIVSHAKYNGYTFEENVQNNCHEWNVNKIYGILVPPSEKGVINQPKDTEFLTPFGRYPGMIQGAHRFSELAKSCPQLTGAVIDDFYHDYPNTLTAGDLHDIKAALMGKSVDENGKVDHSSNATTPDLKLYIVVYEHQLNRVVDKTVLDSIDGVSYWTWKQNENYKNIDGYIETIRKNYPNKEIIAGVYIFNSAQTPTSASIHHLLERTIDLYFKGEVNGVLLFSAIWLSREKISRERWQELALPRFLGRAYYPFLGEGNGRVFDAKTKKPVKNALITVTSPANGKQSIVARKFTNSEGEYGFGGLAGRNSKDAIKYEIRIENPSFKPQIMRVKLRAGESINFSDVRLKR